MGRKGIDARMNRKEPTPYQKRIIALLADGLTAAQIANELHRTEGGIETCIRRLYNHVGAVNRCHLVAVALRAGWIK